jgi:ATP-dependent DNA helicase PIF1
LSRCKQNLSADEIAGFDNAIQLYSTRAAVKKYNHSKIRDLQQPILPIHAIDTGVGASKATLDQCDTVLKLCVCKDAKIMLLHNIWVEMGLVNGTTGTIEDVVWKEGADVKKDLPQALLVAVD